VVIQPPSNNLTALAWAAAASDSAAESWRVGSLLTARPLGFNDDGMLVLQIGALTVETEAPRGQLPSQFQVRVVTLGQDPTLEVMLPAATAESATQIAMRDRLPKQSGYASLLASLDQVTQESRLDTLPAYIQRALLALDHGVRTPAEITRGDTLEQTIQRSGLFLESHLAQPQIDMPAVSHEDWKSCLLKLASLLDDYLPGLPNRTPNSDAPPPLAQLGVLAQARDAAPGLAQLTMDALLARLQSDVHGVLARLEVAQLEATKASAWMIEIPVQGDGGRDVLQVHIERESEMLGVPTWVLGFGIDLPALGPIQGELRLQSVRLSVRLWAERPEAVCRLETEFDHLRDRLAASGLILDQLTCQQGTRKPLGSNTSVFLKATA